MFRVAQASRAYAKPRIARFLRLKDAFPGEQAGDRMMQAKVAAATLALAVPAFLWPPKPARAATIDFALTMSEPAPEAVPLAR